MLPSAHRMRRSADFSAVTRQGRRARSGPLVVHHASLPSLASPPGSAPAAPALVGLVVGKAVGGSVVRHAVSRKLRAQLAARLDRLPAASGTVVRALPDAATADSSALGASLDTALRRVLGS